MFCKKCGYEFSYNDDVKYCKRCGALLIKPDENLTDNEELYDNNALKPDSSNSIHDKDLAGSSGNTATTDKRHSKGAIIACSILAMIIVAVVLWVVLRPKEDDVPDSMESVEVKETEQIVENKVDEFDPFDKIKVSFYGEDGSGSASVEIIDDSEYIHDLSYQVSNYGEALSNGDIVTITLSYKTNEQDYIEKFHRKPASFSKDYSVTSLEEPKSSTEDITSFNQKMKGVWATPDEYGSPYYVYYDGNNNITRSWYLSKAISVSHIKEIKEDDQGRYIIEFECDAFTDFDGSQHEGYPYSSVYESTDDYTSIIEISDGDSEWEYKLVRIATSMEEANKLFESGFNEAYSQIVSGGKLDLTVSNEAITTDWITGTWVNPVSDPLYAFSEEYHFTFHSDGTVDLQGGRNKDHGIYEINDDGTAHVEFSECYYDTSGEGWNTIEGATYSVDIKRSGNSISVQFDDDCYEKTGSNATNGIYDRQ